MWEKIDAAEERVWERIDTAEARGGENGRYGIKERGSNRHC